MQNCKIVKLQNCKIVKLQNCKSAKCFFGNVSNSQYINRTIKSAFSEFQFRKKVERGCQNTCKNCVTRKTAAERKRTERAGAIKIVGRVKNAGNTKTKIGGKI